MTTSCRLLQGIMLVYDITNEKSFDNIRNWIRNIEEVRAPLTRHMLGQHTQEVTSRLTVALIGCHCSTRHRTWSE